MKKIFVFALMFFLAFSLYSQNVLGDVIGLVGYWKLDEPISPAGTIAYDSSIYLNNGTLYNGTKICGGNSTFNASCPQWTVGKYGNALSFDGVDDYVNISHSTSLNITDVITFSAWIKPNKVNAIQRIMGKVVTTPSTNGYLMYVGSTDKVYFGIRKDGVSYGVTSTQTVSLNTWYHVVGVYNKTNVLVYVNGIENVGDAYNGDIGSNTAPLRLTQYIDTAQKFNGTIDEVMIFNRSLSGTEIQNLYDCNQLVCPIITVSSPINTVYYNLLIPLDVSANVEIDSWWYNLNNAGNTTFTPNTTITAITFSNNITVYANDTFGNENSSSVFFTVMFPISDNTIVCFTIKPICINSRDNSIIYKGILYG